MTPNDAVEFAIEKVLHLVNKYSDGSEVWTIYGGVGAWEVLLGYSRDTELLDWLRSLSPNLCDHVYQKFLARWSEVRPDPVRKEVMR